MSHGVVFLRVLHHRSRSLVVVALLSSLGVVAGLLPAAAEPTDAELRQRQSQLTSEREELSGRLEQVQGQRSRLSRALADATTRVDRLTGELHRLRDETAALTAEIEQLEQHAAATQTNLAQRVNALYRGAATNEFMGLLGGTSPGDVTDRSHYLVAMSRHDRSALETAAAVGVRLAQRRGALDEATERQDVVAGQARVAQEELDRRLAEAAEAVDETRGQVAARDQEARQVAGELDGRQKARVRAEKAAAERAAADAAEEAAAEKAAAERAVAQEASAQRPSQAPSRSAPRQAPPPASRAAPAPSGGGSGGGGGGDGMACPQDHPRSFSDTWGAPRSGGRSHQGTDIFGARGGNVFAIANGTIEWTRSGASAGLWLSLRGDNGDRYWYMHLQGFVASAGQRVHAGQLIAYNGDTGNARGTSPHIHFELHPGGGRAVNPYPLLRRVCG